MGWQLGLYNYNDLPKDYKKTNFTVNFSVDYILCKSQDELVSLDAARCLLVSVVEGLLNEINSNANVKDRLEVYPFTSNRLEICLYFEDENKVKIGNGGISVVYFNGKTVKYDRYEIREYTPPTPSGKTYLVHEESYPEALSIVRSQGCLEKL